MKINETVKQILASDEKAFKNLPAPRAMKLLRAVLAAVSKEIASTSEGKVAVPGLGVFVVKQVELEKDGAKVQKKRVVFRAGSPAAKKAKGAAGKKAKQQKQEKPASE